MHARSIQKKLESLKWRNKDIYRDREKKDDTERDTSTDTREGGVERQRETVTPERQERLESKC